MIARRRLQSILILLLPLMALRALLPAGYMVSAAADGPRIVMCSAGLAAWSAPASDPAHRHAPAGDDCPFAHAALGAPPPHYVAVGTVAVLEVRFLPQSFDHLPPTTGPPRRTGARAPPVSQESPLA